MDDYFFKRGRELIMIEFKGSLSAGVRERQISNEKKHNRLVWSFATLGAFVLFVVATVFKIAIEGKFDINMLFSGGIVSYLLIATVVFLVVAIIQFVRPQVRDELKEGKVFSVTFDNDKICYIPESGFGKREFAYSNLKKIVDEGDYYLVVSKEHGIKIVCEKSLLAQGSLKEFDNYFNNIIVRKTDEKYDFDANEKASQKDLKTKDEEVVVEVSSEDEAKRKDDLKVEDNGEGGGVEVLEEKKPEEQKTFSNDKFKKSKTRNEKSFKFALIGIICGLLSVALTPVVVRFGINFAISAVSNIFNSLFYGGFVVEAITFILALLIIVLATVFLFVGCVALMPIVALLSLIFPIYQLVAVNRRWFSWVGLAVGILSIVGCVLLAVTTIGSM